MVLAETAQKVSTTTRGANVAVGADGNVESALAGRNAMSASMDTQTGGADASVSLEFMEITSNV